MKTLGPIASVMKEAYPGPRPSFSHFHVVKAILTIGRRGTIGRKLLAEETGLGAGGVRTLLQRLSRGGLVVSTSAGCRLTDKGSRLHRSLSRRMKAEAVDAGRLGISDHSVAVLVRGASDRVRRGIEQRDVAVRAGADGSTTIFLQDGRFIMPGDSVDCEKDFPDIVWKRLRTLFHPKDGDVLIVCGGPTPRLAEHGALAASLSLLDLL